MGRWYHNPDRWVQGGITPVFHAFRIGKKGNYAEIFFVRLNYGIAANQNMFVNKLDA